MSNRHYIEVDGNQVKAKWAMPVMDATEWEVILAGYIDHDEDGDEIGPILEKVTVTDLGNAVVTDVDMADEDWQQLETALQYEYEYYISLRREDAIMGDYDVT